MSGYQDPGSPGTHSASPVLSLVVQEFAARPRRTEKLDLAPLAPLYAGNQAE
jgi:hypothetical protein